MPTNARSAEFPPETAHRHRYAFPAPVARDTYIVGVCLCGAESRGLAYESTAFMELKRGSRGKRLKA